MDYYQLDATLGLVVQIVVLVLLFAGIWLKSMKSFRQHGISIFTAQALHAVVILAWMVLSFSSLVGSTGSIDFADIIMVASLFHAFTGTAAAVLGI